MARRSSTIRRDTQPDHGERDWATGVPDHNATKHRLLTPDALDLITQRSLADMIVYDHTLTRAGLDTALHRRFIDDIFSHQLVKASDLLDPPAINLTRVLATDELTAYRPGG
jgi:hypothetical protein